MSEVNRRLAYKDLFVEVLEQVVSDRFDGLTPETQFQFEDMTTRHAFVISLNQEEFTKLSSTGFMGAYLTYPQENHEIEWLIPQLLGKNNMPEICAAIVDCITSNPETQTALDTFLQNGGYGSGGGTPEAPDHYDENPLLADGSLITACDNDKLFGAITQLVDLMNSIIEDAFEGFEAATARSERISAVLEAIPITNFLAIDDMIQFADQMLENLAQNYSAQYTQALRDEYRCDLFCAVKDTCELDFQTFADYFMSRAGATIDAVSFGEAVDWFVFGTFSGPAVVHAAHAILAQTLAYGSKFFALDNAWLSKAVTSFMNDPDSDWATLCEDCPDTCTPIASTFSTKPQQVGVSGVYNAELDNWDSSNYTEFDNDIVRGVDVISNASLVGFTTVSVTFQYTKGSPTSNPAAFAILIGGTLIESRLFSAMSNGFQTITGTIGGNTGQINVVVRSSIGNHTGDADITSIDLCE